MVPQDPVIIQKYYDEMHRVIDETAYTGTYNIHVECLYAQYKHEYGKMMELARHVRIQLQRYK